MAQPQKSISEILIPRLQAQFGDRGLRLGAPPSPVAVFPAIHPEVGDIEIYDDGNELTAVTGRFTHGHFSNFEQNLSSDQKFQQIVEDTVHFLEDLFADRVVLWGSHEGCGGWYRQDADHALADEYAQGMPKYVWSGPLE